MDFAAVFSQLSRFARGALGDNLGLKLLSLSFALGLFAYQRSQEDEQHRTVPIGVVARLPAEEDRMLMTALPANVHVTVRGSARAVANLIQTGVAPVEIDLRSGHEQEVSFDANMFSLPPDVEVTIVDPPSIKLEWQDVVTRSIPVQASITGKPAEGFIVKGEPAVSPKQMMMRGPSSVVKTMQFVRLAAFDVSGLTGGVYKRPIAMDAPPSQVKAIGPTSASVSVTIARRLSEMLFSKRPVEIVGVPGGSAVPRTVDVTVIGPPEVVRALRPEQVVPIVDLTKIPGLDLSKQKHGSSHAPVAVDLGRAQAEIQPPRVNVKW